MGLKESGQIGGIKVHPFNTNTVWLAALGSPFGPNDERGIFKTTDGGKTWKKTLFVNNETGGRDIEVDWENPDILYAAMYRGFRKGWDIISGGPASEGGIYKSTDGGETWKHITAGLPQGSDRQDRHRHRAQQPEACSTRWSKRPATRAACTARTTPARSWTLVNSSQRLRARPFYFHYVNVNPKNENEVWVNELGLQKSTDGGKTFTTVETPHGDNHGMWFNPDNPDIILQVNDGGANVSLNGGKSWSSILNQPTAEYYMVAVDEQYPYRLYMPQQDNTHADHPEHAAGVVGLRASGAGVAAGVGLRDRPDLAEARTARSCGARARAKSAATTSRPARRSTTGSIRRIATATIPTRSSTASRARPSSTCRRTTSASSTRRRTCCIARSTKACRGTSSAPT